MAENSNDDLYMPQQESGTLCCRDGVLIEHVINVNALCQQLMLYVNSWWFMSTVDALCQQLMLYVNSWCFMSTVDALCQ